MRSKDALLIASATLCSPSRCIGFRSIAAYSTSTWRRQQPSSGCRSSFVETSKIRSSSSSHDSPPTLSHVFSSKGKRRGTQLFTKQASCSSADTKIKETDTNIFANIPNDMLSTSPSSSSVAPNENESNNIDNENVPSTWNQALARFFLGDIGPPMVVLSILGFASTRLLLSISNHPIPFSMMDVILFATSILFWWIQEYFFHRILLHSPLLNWTGKQIHETHHEKQYFHVSIDPPALLLGWLFTAHFLLKRMLPWHLCLSSTVGYALAGLVYEWSHYIVHTRVKAPLSTPSSRSTPASCWTLQYWMASLFCQMRDNHIRHHLVDDQYWYAFSVPAMDDVFGTNPNVRELLRSTRQQRSTRNEKNEQSTM